MFEQLDSISHRKLIVQKLKCQSNYGDIIFQLQFKHLDIAAQMSFVLKYLISGTLFLILDSQNLMKMDMKQVQTYRKL